MGQPARLPFAEGQQTSQKRAGLVLSLVPTQEGAPPPKQIHIRGPATGTTGQCAVGRSRGGEGGKG